MRRGSAPFAIAVAVAVGGCAKSAAIPLSQDTAMITASAAPMCGPVGAQQVALKQAAISTIKQGYDRFIITGGQYRNNLRVVGTTPVIAQSSGSAVAHGYGGVAHAYGNSTTVVTGGDPIVAGSHDQGLLVKMFRDSDPAGANALSARATLGRDWKSIVENGISTCG